MSSNSAELEGDRDLTTADTDDSVIADIIARLNRQDERITKLEKEVKHKDAKLRKLETEIEGREALIQALQNRNKTLVEILFDRDKWDSGEYLDADTEPVAERVEQFNDRLAELENSVAAISDLGREKSTKEAKVAAIVQYAVNQAADETTGAVALRPKDIQGVTGVTQRYAYNLVDDLPEQYEFFMDKSKVPQYGSLELDKDSQQKAMLVDLELLHEDEQALNKFNNETRSEGGR